MPINSIVEYERYLSADLRAQGLTEWKLFYRWKFPIMCFQRHLRYAEYINNCKCGKLWGPYRFFCRWRLSEHGIKLGFSIPLNVFGPGLSIAHWGYIVVNEQAIIGANCRIHPGTCVGVSHGKCPVIGDNVYLGPGAKVFGGVVIGNNTQIGANAVVTRSYPEGNVTLVGVPAHPSRIA